MRENKIGVGELYNMKVKHLAAMASNRLPRVYMAFFTGHFVFDGFGEMKTDFQKMHKTDCELVAEVKPE